MNGRTVGQVILIATVAFALAPLYRPEAELPIRLHHLVHAAIVIGAGLSALLIVRRTPAPVGRNVPWLLLSITSPMLAMLLMWPSSYSVLDTSALAHVADHLCLALLAFTTAYAGRQYAQGVGVAMSLSLWAMALLAAWGFGVSPPLAVDTVSSEATQSSAQPSRSATAGLKPNVLHGKAIFEENCSACHGAQGQGGMGPSLVGESARKNMQQAIAWIKNPEPPMPKLYPSTLNERDARDVAAFVESLK